jgi:hypothetical protein
VPEYQSPVSSEILMDTEKFDWLLSNLFWQILNFSVNEVVKKRYITMVIDFSTIRLFGEMNHNEVPGGNALGANRSIAAVISFCHPGTATSIRFKGLQMIPAIYCHSEEIHFFC